MPIDVFNTTGDDTQMSSQYFRKIFLPILQIGILILPTAVVGFDTSNEEATCQSIGFKRKTEAFANCVLELISRNQSAKESSSNDPDDATCRKYGFRPKSNEYAQCRLQIDQARQEGQRQQAQYEAQIAEQKKQRSQAAGLALMQMGAGISSGAYNASNGYGSLPTPPNPNRTYILPGGRIMNCTTTGSVTNCF